MHEPGFWRQRAIRVGEALSALRATRLGRQIVAAAAGTSRFCSRAASLAFVKTASHRRLPSVVESRAEGRGEKVGEDRYAP